MAIIEAYNKFFFLKGKTPTLNFCFQFFLLIAVLIFFISMMTNNQMKCRIIHEKKIAMRAGDDE